MFFMKKWRNSFRKWCQIAGFDNNTVLSSQTFIQSWIFSLKHLCQNIPNEVASHLIWQCFKWALILTIKLLSTNCHMKFVSRWTLKISHFFKYIQCRPSFNTNNSESYKTQKFRKVPFGRFFRTIQSSILN